jgi:DNA-binding LacI/PurR family transcriptional regulator
MKEVAAAAGVSITTVSDAMNGKGRLPQTTRDNVRKVANQLGYRPSVIARRLATGNTGNLVLTVSTAEEATFAFGAVDYFVQLMSSATSKALEHGCSLILLHEKGSTVPPGLPLDGAIVIDPVASDPTLAQLHADGIPTVTAGCDPAGGHEGFWVDNDHVAGTRKILDHLEAAGAETVALISGPPVHSYIVDAVKAYGEWCAERDRPPCTSLAPYSMTEAAGYAAAADLLDRHGRPDAIYATLDRLAIGAALAANAHGLTVPNDLLLAGLSDSEASRTAHPPLTTLSLNPKKIGEAAVEMLIALIDGRPLPEPHVRIPTRVIARTSTRRAGSRQSGPRARKRMG